MNSLQEGERLRIYVGELAKVDGRPLFEAIVHRAKESGLAGATVFRAVMGFGDHCQVHTARLLGLSEDLPMLIEIIDRPEKIATFLAELEGMLGDGLITLDRVQMRQFRQTP